MAKDTFYFSHDYNSIQDPKMMDLLSSCGLTGIGMYWIIIEILHQQETGTITLDQFKKYIKFYTAFQTGGQHVLERLEQELIKSNLLVEKDGIVYSERVLSNKKIREEISQKRSLAGIKSAESKGFKTSVEQNPTSVEQNQTKERKGKEIKGKEKKVKNTEFIPPSLSEAKEYFKESGYTEASAERFFNYYNISNWVDSKGNKVKNWKQKANAIWFKDENKQVEIPEGDRMCEFVSKGNFYNKPVQMKYSIYLFHKSNDQFEGDTKLIKML